MRMLLLGSIMPIATLIGVCVCALVANQQLPVRPARDTGPLAARLLADRAADWSTVEVPGVQIHVQQKGATDVERRALAELVSTTRGELLALLGTTKPERTVPIAHVFFVSSREETRRLTGRPLIGFVQSDEPTGLFVYTPGYRIATLVRHELTHLLAFQLWGPTTARPWLVEGLAVWAAGPCQGHSNDALAAGALARGALAPMTELAARFREIDEVVAMPQAGSAVGFLIERHGLASVIQRWRSTEDPRAHPFGADGTSLEQAWLNKLRGVRPAQIDVPRVMKEGC